MYAGPAEAAGTTGKIKERKRIEVLPRKEMNLLRLLFGKFALLL